MTQAPAHPRGRPRDPEVDAAILSAALELLVRRGYAGLTFDAVAELAGVTRATIYRRHSDRASLARAALESLAPGNREAVPAAARDALRWLLLGAAQGLVGRGGLTLVGTLLAENGDPGLIDLFRRYVLLPQHARVRDVLERGIAAGEVRPDVDVALVIDLLFGALLARAMAGGALDATWVDHLLEAVWPAMLA